MMRNFLVYLLAVFIGIAPVSVHANEGIVIDEEVPIEMDEEENQSPESDGRIPSDNFEEELNAMFENLGSQVHNKTALTSATGKGPDNIPYMYILQHGTPAALTIMNLLTGMVTKTFTLEHSTSAWGIEVDEHQNVWIGGTSSGHLYQYNPYTKKLIDAGNMLRNKRDTAILDISVSDGKIIGSTAYNGSIFSYTPSSQEYKDYGQISRGKEFAKSVQFDNQNKKIYIGVGSKAELIRYDIRTKIRKRFLPKEYRNEKYISDIKMADKYLFAQTDPGKKLLVFDKKSLKLLKEFDIDSKTVSPKDPTQDRVYFTKGGMLLFYDLNDQEVKSTEVSLGNRSAITLDFIELHNAEYPGVTLTGLLTNSGEYFLYNLETGKYEKRQAELTPLPVTLYTMLETKEKDKILVNGYMSGGIGFYDINQKTTTDFKDMSQIESATFMNGKYYFGAYPNARVIEFKLDNENLSNSKTAEIVRFKDFGHDRVTALLGDERSNKLFIGAYPETGLGGGLLSEYDFTTQNTRVFENYIPDQSIISLTQIDGYVYGSTTVFANHKRSNAPATLFRFSVDNPEQAEILPFTIKASMISSLLYDGNDKIWGMQMESYLTTILKLDTPSILKSHQLFRDVSKTQNLYLDQMETYMVQLKAYYSVQTQKP
ncbi:WD40 repeat domain-containing protein [Mesobacillus boroniphilus]|nr:WD40 repeat domain-containing protein [Mesobacillus boroniphilus]